MENLFQMERFWSAIPKITPCLSITFQIVLVVVIASTIFGMLVAVLLINKIPVVQQFLKVYISFMRGTPVLIQIMLIYYGLPLFLDWLFGWNTNSWEKILFVEIAFILNVSAFMGEIFRGAIEAVPYDQTEAGYSVGLNKVQTFFRIVLPQAVKIALPAYGADIIEIFHNTSLASMIGVIDFLGKAKAIGIATNHKLEPYVFVLIVYILISSILKFLFSKINDVFSYDK